MLYLRPQIGQGSINSELTSRLGKSTRASLAGEPKTLPFWVPALEGSDFSFEVCCMSHTSLGALSVRMQFSQFYELEVLALALRCNPLYTSLLLFLVSTDRLGNYKETHQSTHVSNAQMRTDKNTEAREHTQAGSHIVTLTCTGSRQAPCHSYRGGRRSSHIVSCT